MKTNAAHTSADKTGGPDAVLRILDSLLADSSQKRLTGSKATTRKVYVGKVLNYFKKPSAAHVLIESGKIKLKDELLIIGETTGVVEMKLNGLSVNDKPADSAEKGNEVTFISPQQVRKNDKVYLVEHIN